MDSYILKSKKQGKQPIYVEFLDYEVSSSINAGYLQFTLTSNIKDAGHFSREQALDAINIIGSAHGGFALISLDNNYVVKQGETDYVSDYDEYIYTEQNQYLAKRMSREEAFKLKHDIINLAKENDYFIEQPRVVHLVKNKVKVKQPKTKSKSKINDKLNLVKDHIQSILEIIK